MLVIQTEVGLSAWTPLRSGAGSLGRSGTLTARADAAVGKVTPTESAGPETTAEAIRLGWGSQNGEPLWPAAAKRFDWINATALRLTAVELLSALEELNGALRNSPSAAASAGSVGPRTAGQ